MYWGFKIDDVEILPKSDSPEQPVGQQITVPLEQKREFSGSIGDKAILISKQGKEWKFTHVGEITNIARANEDFISKLGYISYDITIGKVKQLDEAYSFQDLAYSLKRVHKHYKNPSKHFRSKYFRFTPQDFKVISNGDLFLARTAFGKILNSLHPDHAAAFLKNYLGGNIALVYQGIDYVDAFRELNDYINENILSHLTMLADIAKATQTLAPDKYSELGFASKDTVKDYFVYQKDLVERASSDNPLFFKSNFGEEIISAIEKDGIFEKNYYYSAKSFPIPFVQNQ